MFNQKLEAIAQQRKDVVALTEEFNESLQSFEESFRDDGDLKGREEYQKKLRMFYKDYYTGPVPGRWDESRVGYREQLARDIETGTPLEEIHARVLEEKRQARINQKDIIGEWRERELSNHPGDHPETVKFKVQATAMLNSGNSLEEVLKYMNDEAYKVLTIVPGNRHHILDQINGAKTQEEKRQAKREWHTTTYDEDSPQDREFKQNISRMFESDLPLDQIDSFVIQHKKQQDRKNELHEDMIRTKRSKIEENRYAWRAHVRAKNEKTQKAANRAAERKAAQLEHNTHSCSGIDESGNRCRRSAVPEDEDHGPTECALCNYAIEHGSNIERSFFCSVGCATRNWAWHKRRYHPCDAANCLNTPTPKGAICPECDELFNVKSYFCSPQCLESNKEVHVRTVHSSLREKLKQKINQELREEVSRIESMTVEELEDEINALQDRNMEGSDDEIIIDVHEFEDIKEEFSSNQYTKKTRDAIQDYIENNSDACVDNIATDMVVAIKSNYEEFQKILYRPRN